jgi:hypothetical protein
MRRTEQPNQLDLVRIDGIEAGMEHDDGDKNAHGNRHGTVAGQKQSRSVRAIQGQPMCNCDVLRGRRSRASISFRTRKTH